MPSHVISCYHMPEIGALIRQTRMFDLRKYNMLYFCRSNLTENLKLRDLGRPTAQSTR